MTPLARLLLVLTSVAPIGLVYAGVLATHQHWRAAAAIFGTAILLIAICVGLLFGVSLKVVPLPRVATQVERKTGDSLGFLVAYALPLVAATAPMAHIPWGLVVFAVLVGVLIWRQEMFHVNPVLTLVGYHFYSAQDDLTREILILSRNGRLASGTLRTIQLSSYLWLDCEVSKLQAKEVVDGTHIDDASRWDDPESSD